jgi:hypothetical protein
MPRREMRARGRKVRSRAWAGTIIAAGALLLSACGGDRSSAPAAALSPSAQAGAAKRPSQILITIEAFAGRRATPFGGTIAMPRLANLVSSGKVYDDAVSTTNLTRPALVTVLTGVTPDRSGVRDNIHDALGAGLPTLAAGAAAAGYDTVAIVSTPFASYSSGLQRGFALFDGPEAIAVGPAQHVPPVIKATAVADRFKQWLAARGGDRPFFAWIHIADLNGLSVPLPLEKIKRPGEPEDEFAGYDQALGTIDTAIGGIVDAVKADPRAGGVEWTIVGTHGTCLGDQGRYGDAFWLSDEVLRVPLVRVGADGAHGSVRDHRPTWLPDVAATLARAMGATLDAKAEGVPLDEAPPADRPRLAWGYALDDQLGWPPQTAVRHDNGFTVLYAGEDAKLRPVGETDAASRAAAEARPALPRPRVMTAEVRAAVERAGVKLGRSSPPVIPAKPDTWLRDLQNVRRFESGERSGIAARRSKLLYEAAPEALASILTRLYFFAAQSGTVGSELRDKLLAHFPDRSDALHWSAHRFLFEKRYEAGQALLEAAMAVGPVEPEMHYDLACARSLRGDAPGALAELTRALEAGYKNWDWIDKDPDLANARADAGFAELLRAHGR